MPVMQIMPVIQAKKLKNTKNSVFLIKHFTFFVMPVCYLSEGYRHA